MTDQFSNTISYGATIIDCVELAAAKRAGEDVAQDTADLLIKIKCMGYSAEMLAVLRQILA